MLTEVIASEQPRMYLGNFYGALPIFMIHAIVVIYLFIYFASPGSYVYKKH